MRPPIETPSIAVEFQVLYTEPSIVSMPLRTQEYV